MALASTDGTVWILDGQDGQMLASFTLPGELFSSPVVWEKSLVVGCRNDFVYVLLFFLPLLVHPFKPLMPDLCLAAKMGV